MHGHEKTGELLCVLGDIRCWWRSMRCHFAVAQQSSYNYSSSINLNVARRPTTLATASARSASVNDERCSLATVDRSVPWTGGSGARWNYVVDPQLENWKTFHSSPNSLALWYNYSTLSKQLTLTPNCAVKNTVTMSWKVHLKIEALD